jgi:ATP-dependent RNA helicase DHX29
VRVFDVPEKESGIRKIVLSTNIAETGITIPDCTVVIGKQKKREVERGDEVRDLF